MKPMFFSKKMIWFEPTALSGVFVFSDEWTEVHPYKIKRTYGSILRDHFHFNRACKYRTPVIPMGKEEKFNP